MDIDGNVVDNRFEKFEPSAKRQDLSLDGSLGDNADNIRREVFAVKKVMSKAGAFDFDPGNEPTTVANVRFKTAIRNFQAANDLKVDGLIRPGGPTVHMLGFKTMGQENGRPSGYDAADFKAATGRDPNKLLSGKAIFTEPVTTPILGETAPLGIPTGTREPGEGSSGAGLSRTQQAAHTATFPGGPPPFWPQVPEPPESVKRAFRKFLKAARDGFPIIPEKPEKPDIRTRPALIYRYPDGRVYVAMSFQGKIQRKETGPGKVSFFDLNTEIKITSLNDTSTHPYPKLSDRRSFQERNTAGEESYVYGPVKEKNGTVSFVPLVDPSSRSFLGGGVKLLRAPGGKPIFLTLEQINGMGLRKWHMVEK